MLNSQPILARTNEISPGAILKKFNYGHVLYSEPQNFADAPE